LGTFRVRRVKQRVARDINRKKAVIVPPRLRVKFIPSNDLRKRLNGDE
ncbi:MAG: HU family DNA-binding protein, partial [Atopobiaceae bacterium]|nr:HU family DNA-binding protein [Atopobiaceae bacterium]